MVASLLDSFLSKGVVNTCAVIKNEGRYLTCKTANKCPNVWEWLKMAERNKNGSFPFPAISFSKIKRTLDTMKFSYPRSNQF